MFKMINAYKLVLKRNKDTFQFIDIMPIKLLTSKERTQRLIKYELLCKHDKAIKIK